MRRFNLFLIGLWGIGLTGWIMNLVAFIQCDFADPYKEEIIRGIGIVLAPMGAIVGFINF